MDNLVLKPYDFDRNEEVLELLHRVFKPWDGDLAYFSWKYAELSIDDCPFPRGWVIEQNGKIIAFNGYLPRKIKVGAKTIWALQSFDTATDPDCRGLGLFGKLQKLVCLEVEKAGIPWLYGWASEIGFKVFTQKVGWTIWGKQRFLMRVLDSSWFFQKKIKNRFLGKGLSIAMDLIFRPASSPSSNTKGHIREEPGFPEGTTALCEKWAIKYEIIAIRNRQYLNWRLSNPIMKQRLVCGYEDDRLVAYAVHTVPDSDEVDILDCAWENANVFMAILEDIEKFARQKKSKILRYRITANLEQTRLFKKMGYFWSRTEFPMIGHCVICDSSLMDLLSRESKSVYWSYFDRNE